MSAFFAFVFLLLFLLPKGLICVGAGNDKKKVLSQNAHSAFQFTASAYNMSIAENSIGRRAVTSDNGEMIGVFLPRGYNHGDKHQRFIASTKRLGNFAFLVITHQASEVLNRELQSEFTFAVRATAKRRRSNTLEAEAIMNLRILDENDNSPMFQQLNYTVEVDTSTPTNFRLLQLKAFDADEGINGQIYYSLISPQLSPFFYVEPLTGWIRNFAPLDIAGEYSLNLKIEDRASRIFKRDEERSPLFIRNIANVRIRVVQNVQKPVINFLPFDFEPFFSTPTLAGVFVIVDTTNSSSFFSLSLELAQIDPVSRCSWLDRENTTHFYLWLCPSAEKKPPRTNFPLILSVFTHETPSSFGASKRLISEERFVLKPNLTQRQLIFRDSGPIRFTVNESMPVGAIVWEFSAKTSGQEDKQKLIRYKIKPPKTLFPFELNEQSGQLRLKSELDFEAPARIRQFDFSVVAVINDENGEGDKLESKPLLGTAIVEDSNDNCPTFTNVPLSGIVRLRPENLRPKTHQDRVVFRIAAKDLDSGRNGEIAAYRLLGINGSEEVFSADHLSGEIFVTGSVSKRKRWTAKIFVQDNGWPMVNQAEVQLTFIHPNEKSTLNDENPLFVSTCEMKNNFSPVFQAIEEIFASIDEDTSQSTIVGRIAATDKDLGFNGLVQYVTDDAYFDVNLLSGEVFVRHALPKLVQMKIRSSPTLKSSDFVDHRVVITAWDTAFRERRSETTTLLIRIRGTNMHAPVFEHYGYRVRISDGNKLQTDLLQIKATDEDIGSNGLVEYGLAAPDTDLISVDPHSGIVRVEKAFSHTNNSKSEPFRFLLMAYDGGVPAHITFANLTVDLVEDSNEPLLECARKEHLFAIFEDAPSGTFVGCIGINTTSTHSLLFKTPADADVPVHIDERTGCIFLKLKSSSARVLDNSMFIVNVQTSKKGSDVGVQCSARITILDVKKNLLPPQFSDNAFEASIAENLPPKSVVTKVFAEDPEGTLVNYEIVASSKFGVFEIDRDGVITTSIELDFEEHQHYWLTIRASDSPFKLEHTLFSHIHLLINVLNKNDWSPVFSQPIYFVNVPENWPTNKIIGKVEAVDRDAIESHHNNKKQGGVKYSIVGTELQKFFTIDSNTGFAVTSNQNTSVELTGNVLTGQSALDRESQAEHEIQVSACDSGTPPSCAIANIVISVKDINDNAPAFPKAEIELKVPADSVGYLCRLLSSDSDAPGANSDVHYRIADAPNHLSIDTFGHLYTTQALWPNQTLQFIVISVDSGESPLESATKVSITAFGRTNKFTKSNRRPELVEQKAWNQVTVRQDSPVGTILASVKAFDPDGDLLWWRVLDSAEDSKHTFSLSEGGNLVLARPLPEAYLTKPEFWLEFTVTDGLSANNDKVLIKVEPPLNARPQFPNKFVSVVADSELPAGFLLYHANASFDPRLNIGLSHSLRVQYFLHSVENLNAKKFLHLDEFTGALRVETPEHSSNVVHLSDTNFTIVISARLGSNGKEDFMALNIVPLKLRNRHAPKFLSDKYAFDLDFDALRGQVGAEVGAVEAYDLDNGDNGKVTYEIVNGDEMGLFGLDTASGAISLRHPLPRYFKGTNLTIKSVDSAPISRYTFCVVYLRVVQNASTQVLQKFKKIQLTSNINLGTTICFLETEKLASAKQYTFRAEQTRCRELFGLHFSTGRLYLNKFLVKTEAAVNCIVEVRGMNSDRDEVLELEFITLNVHIQFVERLQFSHSKYHGKVKKDAKTGVRVLEMDTYRTNNTNPLVMNLSKKDDKCSFTTIEYEIIAPRINSKTTTNDEPSFSIDSKCGTISANFKPDTGGLNIYTQFYVIARRTVVPFEFTQMPALVVIETAESSSVFEFTRNFTFSLVLPSLADSVQLGVVLVTISKNSGVFKKLRYSFIEPHIDLFEIDSRTGLVSFNASKNNFVLESLKKEKDCKLWVFVSDGVNSAKTLVNVKIIDEDAFSSKSSALKFRPISVSIRENQIGHNQPLAVLWPDAQFGQTFEFEMLTEHPSFKLDRNLGILYLDSNRSLDRETTSQIKIFVLCKSSDGLLDGYAAITINIEDVNDCVPQFEHVFYSLRLRSNFRNGQQVFVFKASDLDLGMNALLRYELEESAPKFLHLDHYDGRLSIHKNMSDNNWFSGSREPKTYHFVVIAMDRGIPPLHSSANVCLQVVDERQPFFSQQTYNISLSESIEIGADVLAVTANTSQSKSVLGYIIKSGDPWRHFAIDFHSGRIRVNAQLDFRSFKTYQITVEARELTNLQKNLSSLANVYIEVHADVADHAPTSAQKIYQISLPEDTQVGATIGSVGVDVPNDSVAYSLADHKNDSVVKINSKTGDFTLIASLDFHDCQRYEVEIVAKNLYSEQTAHFFLQLTVLDVNNQSPKFVDACPVQKKLLFRFDSSKDVGRNQFLHKFEVDDADTVASFVDDKKFFEFNIEGNYIQKGITYQLDPLLGILTAKKMQTLDFFEHLKQSFSLNISVSDGRHRSFCQIFIEPVSFELLPAMNFEQTFYNFAVSEDRKIEDDVVVGIVRAFGRSPIKYSLVSSMLVDEWPISIDKNSGKITLSRKLDFESAQSMLVPLSAIDSDGQQAFAYAQISVLDENDNAPRFIAASKSGYLMDVNTRLSMHNENQSIAIVLAVDADSSDKLEYTLMPREISQMLSIHPTTGVISFVSGKHLKPSQRELNFFVRASDDGNPPHHSQVPFTMRLGSNAFQPMQFEAIPSFSLIQHTFAVSEDAPTGFEIAKFLPNEFWDSGSHIHYSIDSDGDDADIFSFVLDKDSARLSISRKLNCEEREKHVFMVQITAKSTTNDKQPDRTSYAFVTINVIDVNDNAPIFKTLHKRIDVSEGTHPGTIISVFLAVDADRSEKNSRVFYKLESEESDSSPFRIDREFGFLVLGANLDREKMKTYKLTVVAFDQEGLSSRQSVLVHVLDVNDNPPQFNMLSNSAFVKDVEKVRYSLELQTTDVAHLLNTPLLKFNVTDSDEESFLSKNQKIMLHILNDNSSLFGINANNELTIRKKSNYLFEERQIELLIAATDGLFTSYAVVFVEFLHPQGTQQAVETTKYANEQSCALEFPDETVELGTNLPKHHVVYSLKANTRSQISKILNDDNQLPFSISNKLKLILHERFYQKPNYTLNIFVSRETHDNTEKKQDFCVSRFSCVKTIHLQIKNENRMAPVFKPNKILLRVTENIEPMRDFGHYLATIQAEDDDFGEFGNVFYYIEQTDTAKEDEGFFSVDPSTGVLLLLKPLDRENHSKFDLSIRAVDGGGLYGRAMISIIVEDLNDNAPEFEQTVYVLKLLENDRSKKALLSVKARDSDHNDYISYQIVAADPATMAHHFSISNDGNVWNKDSVDYEKTTHISLYVDAMDSDRPPKRANCTIEIEVLDVNDNSPMFEQSKYEASIAENSMPGTKIVKVSASDADSEHFGKVSYKVVLLPSFNETTTSDPTNYIDVLEDGWIVVGRKETIDFEHIQRISFMVRASDGGTPPLTGETLVLINVFDVNDNAPQFVSCNMTSVVQDGTLPGQTLFSASVVDADVVDQNGPFRIEITGNGATSFAFDPVLNLITTQKLSFFERQTFNLNVRAFDLRGRSSETCFLKIFVQPQSRHPPEIEPLQIELNTLFGEFLGGSIGKVVAYDKDPSDMLRYAIVDRASSVIGATGNTEHRSSSIKFSVNPETGEIWGHPDILPGLHRFNVSVTDGKFTSYALVSLEVRNIDQEALDNSISLTIKGATAEKFIHVYMRRVCELLARLTGVRTDNVRILSIVSLDQQPNQMLSQKTTRLKRSTTREKHRVRKHFSATSAGSANHSAFSIEILLAILQREFTAFHSGQNMYHRTGYLRQKLESAGPQLLVDLPGIEIVSFTSEVCRRDTCMRGECRGRLWLENVNLLQFTAPGFVYISPRHTRTFECVCRPGYAGTYCNVPLNKCSKELCMKHELCIPSDEAALGFVCTCPPGFTGDRCAQLTCQDVNQCSQDEPISLLGKGYFQLQIASSLETRMDLGIEFKTVTTNAVLMHGQGIHDFHSILVVNGSIEYHWNCGTGKTMIRMNFIRVDDGQWHRLRVIRLGRQARLLLDDKYRTEGLSPAGSDVLNLFTYANFLSFGARLIGPLSAGVPSEWQTKRFGQPQDMSPEQLQIAGKAEEAAFDDAGFLEQGTVGCFGRITIDGDPVPKTPQGLRLYNAVIGCDATVMGPCLQGPNCRNGGQCIPNKLEVQAMVSVSEVPYHCNCPQRYTGAHCEIDLNSCVENPCPPGIKCHNLYNDFHCACPAGFTGKTCQMRGDWDLCFNSPCGKNGQCIRALANSSSEHYEFSCKCDEGWSGQFCTEREMMQLEQFKKLLYSSQFAIFIGIIIIALIAVISIIYCCHRWCNRHQQASRGIRKSWSWSSKLTRKPKGIGDGTIRDDGICNPLVPKQIPTPCLGGTIKANAPPLPPKQLRQHRNISNGASGLPTVQVRPMPSSLGMLRQNSREKSHHEGAIALTCRSNTPSLSSHRGADSIGSSRFNSRKKRCSGTGNSSGLRSRAQEVSVSCGNNDQPKSSNSPLMVHLRTRQISANSSSIRRNATELHDDKGCDEMEENSCSDYLTMKPVHRAKPFLHATPKKLGSDDARNNSE